MDKIVVCGDALWISCGTWLGFLNGAIGALAGALVAVVAIVKTIGTQRQLFAIERSEVYTANQIAERKRKADLDRQLEAQRADVQHQLDVAAKEASRQRELAAIADLMALLHEIWWRLDDPQSDTQDLLMRSRAASARWGLEGTFDQYRVLESAVLDISEVALKASRVAVSKLPDWRQMAGKVLRMVGRLERFAHEWPKLVDAGKVAALHDMEQDLKKMKREALELYQTFDVPTGAGRRKPD